MNPCIPCSSLQSTINAVFHRQYDFLRVMVVDLATSPSKIPKKTGITWRQTNDESGIRSMGLSSRLKAAKPVFFYPYHLEFWEGIEVVRRSCSKDAVNSSSSVAL
jgi:hypothetical protein